MNLMSYIELLNEILNKAPESSNAVQNIISIVKTIEENSAHKDKCCISEIKTGRNCFLSVVIRTQGKRPRLLREAIESLNNQTCDDFEIILVGHRVSPENKKVLTDFVDGIDSIISNDKISLYFLDKGNRTAPLNYGFSLCSGQYIAILDDDDTVLPNWVELFKNNANGQILHSYCYEQEWKTENNKSVAISPLKEHFLVDFDLSKQVKLNYCPPHSLAFPSYLVNDFGFLFDEKLTTNEDWDFLMRTANFAGVRNIREPSCIYKKWTDIENSVSVHSKDEWRGNEQQVINKLVRRNILLSLEDSKNYVKYFADFKSESEHYKYILRVYRKYLRLKFCNLLTLGLVPALKKAYMECRKLYRGLIDTK